jgi:hypothetical protein
MSTAKTSKENVKIIEVVSMNKILFTYADKVDKILLFIGFFCAILCGLGLPSFVFLFGDICNSLKDF